MPAESFGTPEGHNVRHDETGAVIAITIVNAKWLLDGDGEIKLTIPSHTVREISTEPSSAPTTAVAASSSRSLSVICRLGAVALAGPRTH